MPPRSSCSHSAASSPATGTRRGHRRREGGVGLLDVEPVGVPVERQPVAGVVGVLERGRDGRRVAPAPDPRRQLGVPPDPTAILGWAGHPTTGAAHLGGRLVEDGLHREHVVPAVPEVVLVPEPVTGAGQHLIEPDAVFEHAVLALLDVERCDEVRRPGIAARAEPVQVAVEPPHRGLDHHMQPVEGEVAGQLEPPPHRRLGTDKVEPDPKAANAGRRITDHRLGDSQRTLHQRHRTIRPDHAQERLLLLRGQLGHELLGEPSYVIWGRHDHQSTIDLNGRHAQPMHETRVPRMLGVAPRLGTGDPCHLSGERGENTGKARSRK